VTPIEKDIALRKAQSIREGLETLGELVKIGLEQYRRDTVKRKAAERVLQQTIEAALDINAHVLAGIGAGAPDDYYESFIRMGENGALDPKLAKELAPAAGLRNRLVHQYDDLDDALVFQSIGNALRLFPRYLQALVAFIESRE
jgi:uncharacterized protein YutE (UPF0331/DUF86 family)